MKPFWTIKAAVNDDSTGEIYLYGFIDSDPSMFGEIDGVNTPLGFVRELDALGNVDNLDIRINSPGGSVFAGQAMYSILQRHPARKTITVDGLAASIASVIAMAGDEVVMPSNAMMLVHNPHGLSMGFAADHRKAADELDSIREGMIAAYKDKTGLRRNAIIKIMDEETWLTASEAKEQGFADRVDARTIAASMATKDLLVVNGLGVQLDRYDTRPPVHKITEPFRDNAETLVGALSAFEARTLARAGTREKAGRALGKTDLAYWQQIRDAADRVLDSVDEDSVATPSTLSEPQGLTGEQRERALELRAQYGGIESA